MTDKLLRLDVALIRLHPELSRRKAQDAIGKGQVSIDGRVSREPGESVTEAAEIRWDRNRKATPKTRISLPLLYADDDLVIVDKPAGLLSVPTSPDARNEDTALARVMDYARHRSPRRPFAGAVHRLDRDTSGALAFALNAEAKRALRDLFREHRIERNYAAIAMGAPKHDQGTIDAPIHDAYEGGRRRIARGDEPSREAVTRFKVLERFQGAALVEVALETGRQHQIRLHLAHVGLPVLGDPVYGRGAKAPAPQVPRQ
ncbi:MAG TPA: RluA family pseudouridine synthase, partial [Vicinamibacteria bacterium]|nr:RluA family pseudouridine synthase [Vicinamibacteria bacterium]